MRVLPFVTRTRPSLSNKGSLLACRLFSRERIARTDRTAHVGYRGCARCLIGFSIDAFPTQGSTALASDDYVGVASLSARTEADHHLRCAPDEGHYADKLVAVEM